MLIQELQRKYPSSFQLVYEYLEYNSNNPLNSWSLRTFLSYNLHGRAKSYMAGYVQRAEKILDDLYDEEVVDFRLVRGAKHWFWVPPQDG